MRVEMSCAPVLEVDTIRTTKRFRGSRAIVTRLMSCPRCDSFRFAVHEDRHTYDPRAHGVVKLERKPPRVHAARLR
ncbi:MAG: hypothetical protein QOF37_1879, partial [Thermoleophilaceae bacterium]|nr:hypothetical protein [Thermoleophilaceae bacterium]